MPAETCTQYLSAYANGWSETVKQIARRGGMFSGRHYRRDNTGAGGNASYDQVSIPGISVCIESELLPLHNTLHHY